MNTFFAFALAIGSSFASIQGFRIYYNKRKNKNQVRLILLFSSNFLIGITIGRQNLTANCYLTFHKRDWDKSPSLSFVLIVEQDAVVEWALLR